MRIQTRSAVLDCHLVAAQVLGHQVPGLPLGLVREGADDLPVLAHNVESPAVRHIEFVEVNGQGVGVLDAPGGSPDDAVQLPLGLGNGEEIHIHVVDLAEDDTLRKALLAVCDLDLALDVHHRQVVDANSAQVDVRVGLEVRELTRSLGRCRGSEQETGREPHRGRCRARYGALLTSAGTGVSRPLTSTSHTLRFDLIPLR
eukprot:gene8878-biopygen321